MTLIGMHEINGRVAPFCQQYLFSQPQLALYDQWECMCLINASLSSTGWYRHSEDRLTVHIYYVECLAQGTYVAHVHLLLNIHNNIVEENVMHVHVCI